MARQEHHPQDDRNPLLPDPATVTKLVRENFYYRYGYHRTEFGRDLLRGRIRAMSTLIDFRATHPDLPHNDVLLRDSLVERAVDIKLVSLGDITPFSKLETEIFGPDSPTFPE